MKTNFFIFLVILSALMPPQLAEAQIRRLLQEKAREAIMGTKVEEEKATETQQQIQPEHSKPKPAGPNILERRMMQAMGLSNVKYDQTYNFTLSMKMVVETIDSLKNMEKTEYSTFYNTNDKNFAMIFESKNRETGQKQKGTMIYDLKNNAMLILSEENGERSGVAFAIPPDSTSVSGTEDVVVKTISEDFDHPYYKATGKTKTIGGHLCKEYIYQTLEDKVTLWITKEKNLNLSGAYEQMPGLQTLASAGMGFGMGLVMEMEVTNTFSDAKTHMLIKEIHTNNSKHFNISNYRIVGLGQQQ